MAARGETQANVEVSTLVVPAWRLRWRAPELALVLGERALALASARHDEADRLRAESVVVFAGNRVGRGVRIADRAIDALKAAETAGEHETAWLLRVELAACARSVGAPLTGFAAVTPVLEAPDVPAELRASALVQASECLVTVGRGDEPTQALAEADQLYVADTTLDDDTRLLLRGLIRAVQAAQHRRWGDIAAAIGAAREGLDLLSRFADPSADSGQGMGRLTLELVLALMDANRLLDASEVGTPMLDRPVRAPSASTTGWLRLALATRVHLPAGRVALAREMLREAAASAERHQLDTLLAESLLALAHVHEVSGDLADALTNLRSAHAAERRRARAVYAVRARLAAEFSGVHRQPADLHQQLASLLRPIDGMQMVSDGILSAALKQQLRQWRPVQVRKGDGLKVKRARRAAEDMTVEGLSAARQHAADRWRMVQPFGEPDDKTPDPVEPQPPAASSSDRTVPASGLIASAGAMVSGRRRAARVAAGEIDDDQPSTPATAPTPPPPPPPPPPAPAETPALTPEQERKRKVEQQLMELQREARRQIEAERQARAELRAAAEREAAEAAARQARMEREAAEEAARQAAARQEASRAQPESVMDMLKAQGLRAGGRRRAPDTEAQPETPSWRVEPPSRLRQDDQSPSYFADPGAHSAPETSTGPAYFADPSTADTPSRSGLAAAFSRPPAAPDLGPHTDDAAYPLHTPAAGFPTSPPDQDERKLPTPDYTSFDFSTPQWSTASIPSPDPAEPPDPAQPTPDPTPNPERKPFPPIPDPIPPVPTPDEIPPSPEPDLLSSTFLSSADVEREDDTSALPTTPVRTNLTSDQAYGTQSGQGTQPGFGAQSGSGPDPGFGSHPGSGAESGFGTQPSPGGQPSFGTQTGFSTQQTFGTQTSFGAQPTFGAQTNFGPQSTFGTQSAHVGQPDPATPAQPGPSAQSDPTGAGFSRIPQPDATDQGPQPDPGAWANFDIAPDYDVSSNLVMFTGPGTGAGSEPATQPNIPTGASQPTPSDPTGFGNSDVDTGFDPAARSADLAASAGFGSAASADSATGAGFGSDAGSPTGLSFDPAPPASSTGFGSPTQPGSPPEYNFFSTESEPATQPDSTPQFGTTEPGTATHSEAAAESGLTTPADGEPATEMDESGTRSGRPSSRRKPSDLSLADLLAEALVAYETGRRSDEEQLDASDLSASKWSDAGQSDVPDQPYSAQRPEAEQPGADSLYSPGQFGAAQPSDSVFRPGASQQPVLQPADAPAYFLTQQPSAEPAAQPGPETPFGAERPESEQEKTGPIVPVGATPDNESTGPIRPVRPDGPAGWTLPGM
ncbi:hypothetical protein C8D88_114134 [Lentzea atacamensis]|uniref:Uncharacterized protein n=1 Tax=Lentzea atacamensis TaxID=531938 RepID=A0A316HM32_9PSEU|nr:hypothetical protein [Lentzea atacamensis]PWK82265.1 hypothetical protein C8D88_114134 [Lentzea atacamensis]